METDPKKREKGGEGCLRDQIDRNFVNLGYFLHFGQYFQKEFFKKSKILSFFCYRKIGLVKFYKIKSLFWQF